MPEIGTYGSMSGDGKRGDAAWPKLPRPSSTLPFCPLSDIKSVAQSRSRQYGSKCYLASDAEASDVIYPKV